ncbi:formate dehydrogenase, alpha subunit [Methylococcus capsulatus str. Bath]|uniref:NADH-quinone oxidoreductase subunit G n=1 Tax=Methylococcus capsulatus (strain ATCC 33009 / NCIMB 11132 / Bath) TaxID=243233 RepID=Q604G7_METCA|nr:formate dehydrogenase subunit alpha [Methylococcus capsulatus]AAU91344.1 formate dehydrogenase, alpha subunit [Methylococcus capsulatus str. Bath]
MNPSDEIVFKLDGRPVGARPGEAILQAARRHGVEIPHLCYRDGLRPDGNCRACVVEIEGERVLAASCCRTPGEGMEVRSDSPRARSAQRMVVELLLADQPETSRSRDDELRQWAERLGVSGSRFPGREAPPPDRSNPAIAVQLDACIQCTRCVRACRETQVNDVIGYAYRGSHARIVFDQGDPMGLSSCVSCGECVQVCPTGALAPGNGAALLEADRRVDSGCPYCGVGCQLTYHVKDGKIVKVTGRDGPANHGRLCVKGRYGFDYPAHRQRLTQPLIRKPGIAKDPQGELDPADPLAAFRPASWEEALDFAADGLKRIIAEHGKHALAGFGSAKGSNEEAYLFQKLVRTGFGTNNVDHCTRLCHASSVVALLEGVGSGAVSNPVADVQHAEVVVVIGSNPIVNHPVAATFIKNAVKKGTTQLILMDPRRTELARHAAYHLPFRPDSDVALLNALLHVIVTEGLVDEEFVRLRTENYEALKQNVLAYSPEAMAPICGIDARTLREVARLYARSRASMILWGMGVSQHVHGTDNVRCLIALAMVTGQIGRPGTGLHPLRGQNNVQGASDVGLIPMCFPDYLRVDDEAARAKFERLWGVPLDGQPGLTVVEIIDAACAGRIKGMYIEGENPAMSDPNSNHAREGLASLEHLIVQDLFMTETAYFADVILPASAYAEKTGTFTNTDRIVQIGRQAVTPPGEARQDLWIIQEIARRLGLDWNYQGPREVFEEMRSAMPSIAGISWERLEREGHVTYPCASETDPGQPVIFTERFPTPSGRARIVPADIIPADERPDADYPLVLITGRQLEHWHTGSMTRRASVLDAIEPAPTVSVHPLDLEGIGAEAGDVLTVESRRGRIALFARADDGIPRGSVFIPFCYYEAAANRLTNQALDPYAKIAELKYCAVRVRKGGTVGREFGYQLRGRVA